jgi:hypothetical protein
MNKELANNTTKHASIGFVNTDTSANGKFGGQIGFWPEDGNASKQQFRIYTSGASSGYNLPVQQMVVNGDGFVGVGVAAPTARLQVKASGTGNPNINGLYVYNPTSGSGDAIITARVNGAGGDPYVSFDVNGIAGWAFGVDSSDSQKLKWNHSWSSLTSATKMTLDNTGQLGIGTDGPAHQLHVVDTASVVAEFQNTGDTARLQLNGSSGNGGDLIFQQAGTSTWGIASIADKLYILGDDAISQKRMTFLNDGTIIMNGDTNAGSSNGLLTIYCTAGTKLQDAFIMYAAVESNIIGFFFNTAGGSRGSIGGIDASTIRYSTTSDVRLKKQIKPMQSTLDRVNALKPSTYTWIRDEAKGFGFIAQEVFEVFPELKPVVPYSGCTCKCGAERCESCTLCDDEHDYPKNKDGSDFLFGLDYGTFTPFLTKAIQELDVKVEEKHNRKSLVTGVDYSKIDDYEGLIVSASINDYKNGRPVLKLSNTENDKKSYGVILGKAKSVDNETNVQKSGDGRMWVVNTCGNLESGDLVTTSNIGGYGKRQDDDILRSYTIAKLTQDCDFTEKYIPVKRVKQEMKDVTYYLQENYIQIPDMRTVKEEDVIEREVPMYVKSVEEGEDYDTKIITPEISEEEYEALTEEEKKSYTVSHFKSITSYEYNRIPEAEKVDYQKMIQKHNCTKELYESTKPMPDCCGEYTTEVRQELVDVLDDNDQLIWEETNEMELVYKIRYLDTSGAQTDEANTVHTAAFVGCTYHCG